MSFVDVIVDEVANAPQLSAEVKGIATSFLQANRPLLEALGAEAARDFFATLSLRGSTPAWETLVGHLGQEELLELLRSTEAEMEGAIERRQQAINQWRDFAEALGAVALRLVMRVILAAV